MQKKFNLLCEYNYFKNYFFKILFFNKKLTLNSFTLFHKNEKSLCSKIRMKISHYN